VSEWFDRERWDGRALVSDGAKALVKLALNGLGCPSVPDVFHLLSGLRSKTMGTAIARHRVQFTKQQHTCRNQGAPSSSTTETAANHGITSNKPWKPTIRTISKVCTFPSDSPEYRESQLGLELPPALQTPWTPWHG